MALDVSLEHNRAHCLTSVTRILVGQPLWRSNACRIERSGGLEFLNRRDAIGVLTGVLDNGNVLSGCEPMLVEPIGWVVVLFIARQIVVKRPAPARTPACAQST